MEKDYNIEIVNDEGKSYAIAVPKDANVKSAVINQYRDDGNESYVYIEKLHERSNAFKKNEKFQAILCHFSEPSIPYNDITPDKYDKCITQWKPYAAKKGNSTCICSQPHIEDLRYIINKDNKNILLVGSCCIEKFGGDALIESNKELTSELAKVFTCSICKALTLVSNSHYKGVCNGCSATQAPTYLQALKTRCRGCEKFRKITKGLCNKCCRDSKSICPECDEVFTKGASFHRSCTQCYRKTSLTTEDATYKECVTCNKAFKVNPAYPKNKECYPCFCLKKLTTGAALAKNPTTGEQQYKTCITCNNQFEIKAEYPHNKECYPCYKKRRQY